MAIAYQVVYLLIALLASLCAAFPLLDPSNVHVQQSRRDTLSRADWDGTYNISTSYPSTGVTVEYTLKITDSTCNPDGSGDRPCMLVNNQYPGPKLRAQWGDFIEVTIINNMQNSGTSIHFHDVRQLNTPGSNGVNGIAMSPHGSEGNYNHVQLQSGKRYRLRLISASTINYLRVSLDGHEMLVIAADFIPFVPFTAESLLLRIGQRYDVVNTANQTTASCWFRVISPNSCFGVASANGTAIWTYDSLTPSIPTSSDRADETSDCSDETFTSVSNSSKRGMTS